MTPCTRTIGADGPYYIQQNQSHLHRSFLRAYFVGFADLHLSLFWREEGRKCGGPKGGVPCENDVNVPIVGQIEQNGV